MKVRMIGTGAIWTKYNSSFALVNENMILDVPNGALKQLLNQECQVEKIRTIVITHMHGDHIADLPFLLIDLIFKGVRDNITVLGPQGIEITVKTLFDAYHLNMDLVKDKVKYIEVKNGKEYDINNNHIKPILVSHNIKPAYGYVINHQLGFSGDTGLCNGLEEIIQESKASIVDSSLMIGNDRHAGINDIEYLAQKYHKRIIVTHLRDETRMEWKNKEIEQIVVPEDGYTFEI